ncbi:MAG: acyl-ACP--UDP-N-acetylglucosamine O-acyltransferase [Alphaproteobacteria bacterium]|nr:acyl-ACP--UDP-N-acetylglucosamine O-acyltransferase [Alphaproteobacteria bacterium]
MSIHATAVIDPSAELGDVEIGPYAVIGPRVRLADGVVVGAHASIERDTDVGARTHVGNHAAIGGDAQDRGHDRTAHCVLRIGTDNVFREFSTAHRGSSQHSRETIIGHRNYFMANSHVAHDCVIGDDTMFANSAAVAGHVRVGDGAILGGLCAVHQHCRVGRLAMVGGGAMCAQDVPPFALAQGDRARLYGVNIIGLRRHGMDDASIAAVKDAWRVLFTSELPWKTALARVEETQGENAAVQELLAFLRTSTRGVCRAGFDT